MGFLSNKISTKIEFTVPVGEEEAKVIQQYVQTVIENTNTSELEILAKLVKKNLIKNKALEAAKKYV